MKDKFYKAKDWGIVASIIESQSPRIVILTFIQRKTSLKTTTLPYK